MIENLGIDSEKLDSVSRYTVYEENNGAIVMTTCPRMTHISKHINVSYHWFWQHVGKKFVIQKIESKNQKADIFTKGLQGSFLSVCGSFYVDGNPYYDRECKTRWHIQP